MTKEDGSASQQSQRQVVTISRSEVHDDKMKCSSFLEQPESGMPFDKPKPGLSSSDSSSNSHEQGCHHTKYLMNALNSAPVFPNTETVASTTTRPTTPDEENGTAECVPSRLSRAEEQTTTQTASPHDSPNNFGIFSFIRSNLSYHVVFVFFVVVAVSVGLVVFLVIIMGNKANNKSSNSSLSPPSNPFPDDPERVAYLQELRALFVPPYLLTDTNAPQNLATERMAFQDNPRLNLTSPRLEQRYALSVIYFATGGAAWTVEWDSEQHECSWTFVGCNARDEVISLMMGTGAKMTGRLPTEIGFLSQMQHVSFSDNRLEGTVPEELYDLTDLVTLRLAINEFSSTLSSKVGNLTSLEILDINSNLFQGPLPDSIHKLSKLKTFYCSSNEFVGPLFEYVLQWPDLEHLEFSYTDFTGTIPSEIGLMSNLHTLETFRASLVGTIPEEIANAPLVELYLIDNLLEGSIPSTLGKLSSLRRLGIVNSFITSTLPASLGKLSILEELLLTNNLLEGTIPTELGSLQTLYALSLAGNRLTGTIPSEIGKLGQLTRFLLNLNRLTGSVPEEICLLQNLTEFQIDCDTFVCDCCVLC